MRVIGDLQLILDDHHLAGGLVMTEKIQREAADGMLSALEDKVHAQKVGQHVNVVEEPRGEVQRFMGPYFSWKNRIQPAEVDCHAQSLWRTVASTARRRQAAAALDPTEGRGSHPGAHRRVQRPGLY